MRVEEAGEVRGREGVEGVPLGGAGREVEEGGARVGGGRVLGGGPGVATTLARVEVVEGATLLVLALRWAMIGGNEL